jgi:hypothetical protein
MTRSIRVLGPLVLAALASAAPVLLARAPAPGDDPPGNGPPAEQPAPPPNPSPKRELDSLKIVKADPENAGFVSGGMLATRVITFKNTRGTPVRLKVISSTCGCMKAAFSADEVKPGEEVTLSLSATPAPSAAPQAQACVFQADWVEDGQPRKERGSIALRYRTNVSFVARPEKLRIDVFEGQPIAADFFVHALDADSALTAPGPQISCDLPESRATAIRTPEGHPGVLVLGITAPALPIGDHRATVTISDRLPDASPVPIPVFIRVHPVWRPRPAGVVMMPGPTEPAIVRLTRVAPAGSEPARVAWAGGQAFADAQLERNDGGWTIRIPRPTSDATDRSDYLLVQDRDGRTLLDLPVAFLAR